MAAKEERLIPEFGKYPEVDTERDSVMLADREYFILPPERLGILRKRAFDKHMVEVFFHGTVADIIKRLLAVERNYNLGKHSDALYEVKNLLFTAGRLNEGSDAVIRACTVFMVTADEDLKLALTDSQEREKVKVWAASGAPWDFFYTTLSRSVDMLTARLESAIQTMHPQTPTPEGPGRGDVEGR